MEQWQGPFELLQVASITKETVETDSLMHTRAKRDLPSTHGEYEWRVRIIASPLRMDLFVPRELVAPGECLATLVTAVANITHA